MSAVDFSAQASDLHVDCAVVDFVVVQPRKIKKTIARKDALRCRKERDEQVEFVVCECNDMAIRHGQAAQSHVEFAPRKSIRSYASECIRACLVCAGSPKEGANSGNEFARRERFRYVVVRAEFQTHYAIGFV